MDIPMLIDCCTFYNENDVFLLRYVELFPYVDRFIVLEALETHRGDTKPLYFKYAHFPKVEHLVLDHYPIMGSNDQSASDREWYGRDYITHHLDCAPNDYVMLSDVDEIPNLERLISTGRINTISPHDVVAFEQYLSYYYINHRADYKWYGTKLAQRQAFNLLGDIRRMHMCDCLIVPNGGWHASYLGGIENIQTKMNVFCHRDMVQSANTRENIERSIENGTDMFSRGERFIKVSVDSTFPKNIQDFPQFIKE